MTLMDRVQDIWPHIVAVITILVSVGASGHVILHKREVRSAIAWVGVIWLVPVIGAFLYILFGINRIRRRARALRGDKIMLGKGNAEFGGWGDGGILLPGQYGSLAKLVGNIIQMPLTQGNAVTPLVNGEEAFPAMIKAIDEARRTVTLSTYIFDNDGAGGMFVDALARAARRGVGVRVLVDDMGARYSWPPITRKLRDKGVEVARFLPTLLPWRMPFMNLRNHRKILVVDGEKGFTGGMNIREGVLLTRFPAHPLQDLHFSFQGPVVASFQRVFAEDWAFTTGKRLDGEEWFPSIQDKGPVIARGIPDGPDEDFEKLLWTYHGALACAKTSIRIVTPYFLPDSSLITSLNLAAMRGVKVEIVLPSVNNLTMVKWASTDLLLQLIDHGCSVWMTPGPFDHTKLMIMDDLWALVGSANWDPRSFRLDFEFNVECYDRELVNILNGLIDRKLSNAGRVTREDVQGRALSVKLRDGIARLFSPYL